MTLATLFSLIMPERAKQEGLCQLLCSYAFSVKPISSLSDPPQFLFNDFLKNGEFLGANDRFAVDQKAGGA